MTQGQPRDEWWKMSLECKHNFQMDIEGGIKCTKCGREGYAHPSWYKIHRREIYQRLLTDEFNRRFNDEQDNDDRR